MAKLPGYLKQIEEIYSAIGKKVQDLIFLLNETETAHDPHTEQLVQRITGFLSSLEKNVLQEKGLVQELPGKKKKPFLKLLQSELQTIRELNAYVKLSKQKPTPTVIKKINELNKAVEKEINQQEALAA